MRHKEARGMSVCEHGLELILTGDASAPADLWFTRRQVRRVSERASRIACIKGKH